MKIAGNKLKHHPVNRKIYDLSSIDALMSSISDVGLLQNLVIDQNNQVISENRRLEAVTRRVGATQRARPEPDPGIYGLNEWLLTLCSLGIKSRHQVNVCFSSVSDISDLARLGRSRGAKDSPKETADHEQETADPVKAMFQPNQCDDPAHDRWHDGLHQAVE